MIATISLLLDQLGLGRYGAVANAVECGALCAAAFIIARSAKRPTVVALPPTLLAEVIAEAEAAIAADRRHATA